MLPMLVNLWALGWAYKGSMDDMLRIPKDRPRRRPLMLVALMAVTGLLLLVAFLR